MARRIALTFDVDMANYAGSSWEHFDEVEQCVPAIQRCLEEFPEITTTWFVRIDSQIEQLYGRADFILDRHAQTIDWLQQRGHEIAWHHHAYERVGTQWKQDTNEETILTAIDRYGAMARELGMTSARMGWSHHTNATLRKVAELGFRIDSSAMPRPQYRWEATVKDWSLTPQTPYRPSVADYRVPGHPAVGILEVPMTTTEIAAPTDTEVVKRYINPAYRPEVFATALRRTAALDLVVLICHPYETASVGSHPLLAFSIDAFRENLMTLRRHGAEFTTLEASPE